MKYIVKEVSNNDELKEFCQFQNKLYANNETYVPTLDYDQMSALSKSPCLEYCARKLFLAYSESQRVVGRCCAIINLRYNILNNVRRMSFGWTDFIDDYEVFRAMMDKAVEWGRGEGVTEIHGPVGYNSLYQQGMVIEGFNNVPRFNNLYNAAYYPNFVEKYGFRKESDLIQYKLHGQLGVSEEMERRGEDFMRKSGLHTVKMSKFRKHKGAVARFFEQYNASLSDIRDFTPLTDSEISQEGAKLLARSNNNLSCLIVDQKNEVAAFAICLGDMSEALRKANGSRWPWGWRYLKKSQKEFQDVDLMMTGFNPKYKGTDIVAACQSALSAMFKAQNVRYCITNPLFEGSEALKAWDGYTHKEPYIRRRRYIMSI